jgi:hypothetical protein
MNRFNFRRNSIVTFPPGKKLDYSVIIEAVEDFTERVQPNDTVFLFFAGHGGQHTHERRRYQYILSEDELPIFDKHLEHLFNNIARKTEFLTVVFDCCCAGGQTREVTDLTSSFPATENLPVGYRARYYRQPLVSTTKLNEILVTIPQSPPAVSYHYVFCGASLSTQPALEFELTNGSHFGCFSHYACDLLSNKDMKVSYKMFCKNVGNLLSQRSQRLNKQVPITEGRFIDDEWFSPDPKPPEYHVVVLGPDSLTTDSVFLNGGTLQGIHVHSLLKTFLRGKEVTLQVTASSDRTSVAKIVDSFNVSRADLLSAICDLVSTSLETPMLVVSANFKTYLSPGHAVCNICEVADITSANVIVQTEIDNRVYFAIRDANQEKIRASSSFFPPSFDRNRGRWYNEKIFDAKWESLVKFRRFMTLSSPVTLPQTFPNVKVSIEGAFEIDKKRNIYHAQAGTQIAFKMINHEHFSVYPFAFTCFESGKVDFTYPKRGGVMSILVRGEEEFVVLAVGDDNDMPLPNDKCHAMTLLHPDFENKDITFIAIKLFFTDKWTDMSYNDSTPKEIEKTLMKFRGDPESEIGGYGLNRNENAAINWRVDTFWITFC